jgi:hypothetical protein
MQPYSDLAYWIETVPEGLRIFLMGSAVNLEKSIPTSTQRLAASVLRLQAAMESDRTTDARKALQQRQFGAQLARLIAGLAVPMLDQFRQARLDLAESTPMSQGCCRSAVRLPLCNSRWCAVWGYRRIIVGATTCSLSGAAGGFASSSRSTDDLPAPKARARGLARTQL